MSIKEPQFHYGPISQGVFMALVVASTLVHFYAPAYFWGYLAFLAFLGVGLRPFLEVSGLYNVYQALCFWWSERSDRRFVAQRRREVRLQEHAKKYRKQRLRDPRLPKNW